MKPKMTGPLIGMDLKRASISARREAQLNQSIDAEVLNDLIYQENAAAKEQLKIDTNLEDYVGKVFVNGPYFEFPTIKFSPRGDEYGEERAYTQNQSMTNQVKEGNDMASSPPNKSWSALTKAITNKFASKLPIKDIMS